jgi:hypothetical protein
VGQSSRPEIYVQQLPKPRDFYYGGRQGPVRQRRLTNDILGAPLPPASLGWKDFKHLHDALWARREGIRVGAMTEQHHSSFSGLNLVGGLG